jgi:predicted SAM-dependent methyltransferase
MSEKLESVLHLFDEKSYLQANVDVRAAVEARQFSSGKEHYLKFGYSEGRPLRISGVHRRAEKVLLEINTSGRGLEIGPSHNPIAPKSSGYRVEIVDHLSAQNLKEKYKGHNLQLEKIEEVDYVWSGEKLSELVGKPNYYNWIIASHVIEHVPDLISFFQECEKLLVKGSGVLALIVPDMRYCFDCLSPLTSVGELLDAHQSKRNRPTAGQIFNHYSRASLRNGVIAWDQKERGDMSFAHTFSEASEMYKKAVNSSDYNDIHCWRFIPKSFELIINDLNELGMIGLSIHSSYETTGCEFHINLRVSGESRKRLSEADRLLYLTEIADLS